MSLRRQHLSLVVVPVFVRAFISVFIPVFHTFFQAGFIMVVWAGAYGCARPIADGSDPDRRSNQGDAGSEGEGEQQLPGPDPFAPWPDTSEGLTNTSFDLTVLLENGQLEGACEAWEADPTNRKKKLLCGKSMFFYEGFGTVGVPTLLFDFFGNRFPEVTGTAWSGFGAVPDPATTNPVLPLGVGPGAPLGEGVTAVQTLAYTCASCHFARLPDGRYSVGAPNHDYEYGRQFLAISIPPAAIAPGFDPAEHHPDAMADVQPLIAALEQNNMLKLELMFDLLPLIGQARPEFDIDTEGHYAHWLSGTMDFMMKPLPLDDQTHTVSKILSLWGMATPEETEAAGMENEQLAWTGGAESLMEFLEGFVAIGDGSATEWSTDRLSPLYEYLLSLRPPANPTPPPADIAARGREQFSAHCFQCHDGPRGMGRSLYTYEEIRTDDAMKAWGDAELDGTYCCGFEGTPTHAVKSPRLVGLWAQRRFLHNGSVASLEELLCLTPRTINDQDAQGSGGHTYGCELDVAARTELIAFLRSL